MALYWTKVAYEEKGAILSLIVLLFLFNECLFQRQIRFNKKDRVGHVDTKPQPTSSNTLKKEDEK